MDQPRSESRRQRKHSHLQVLEIEDDGDARVCKTGTVIKLVIGQFGQDELRGHDIAVDQLFTNALQNGFEELMHVIVGALAQLHELFVLAEIVEEKLPDRSEVFL